jgi:amino acid permease
MTTVEIDSQCHGLLENYDRVDRGANQQTTLCDPSQSDNERPSSSSSSLTTTNKSLTYLNCLALVIGIQIGSGIFSAPAIVSNHVPNPAAGILLWALAGVLVWSGASCFIELGTSIPRNGGMQDYLRAGYCDFALFVRLAVHCAAMLHRDDCDDLCRTHQWDCATSARVTGGLGRE